jgi:hypothetical protein
MAYSFVMSSALTMPKRRAFRFTAGRLAWPTIYPQARSLIPCDRTSSTTTGRTNSWPLSRSSRASTLTRRHSAASASQMSRLPDPMFQTRLLRLVRLDRQIAHHALEAPLIGVVIFPALEIADKARMELRWPASPVFMTAISRSRESFLKTSRRLSSGPARVCLM